MLIHKTTTTHLASDIGVTAELDSQLLVYVESMRNKVAAPGCKAGFGARSGRALAVSDMTNVLATEMYPAGYKGCGHLPPGHLLPGLLPPGLLPPGLLPPWSIAPRSFAPWSFAPTLNGCCNQSLSKCEIRTYFIGNEIINN